MNYLMINTAGKTTEILLSAAGKKTFFCDENGLHASAVLLQAIDKMLCAANVKLNDMDFFACVTGPGSFTGIRIGLVTTKTFCYALNKKAVGINYNRLISYAAPGKRLAVVHGWADVYYAAKYDGDEEIMPPTAFKKSELEKLIDRSPDYTVVCDAVSGAAMGGITADERNCMEIAVQNGRPISGDRLEPLYAMKSQAERELDK